MSIPLASSSGMFCDSSGRTCGIVRMCVCDQLTCAARRLAEPDSSMVLATSSLVEDEESSKTTFTYTVSHRLKEKFTPEQDTANSVCTELWPLWLALVGIFRDVVEVSLCAPPTLLETLLSTRETKRVRLRSGRPELWHTLEYVGDGKHMEQITGAVNESFCGCAAGHETTGCGYSKLIRMFVYCDYYDNIAVLLSDLLCAPFTS
eukprot:2739235-Amphidinium_carterae.1